ncbi:MAG TPA: o-succinylbenzoate synthase [Pyrinomonadaceae bacterium]|jgi:O-succinylbenzoate synthase|nr:o-succinylbenzoate synthase [Pyrinomonadaceae bacterium]
MTSVITQKQIRVESIILHRVRVPLVEPFRISNGSVAEKDSILIEARTDDGVVGWGEASPMSGAFYSDDTPDGAWNALVENMIPRVFDLDDVEPSHLYLSLRELSGDHFAKAGLEGALWDAYAQRAGVPLCELLGAKLRPVPSGVAIGIFDEIDELIERVERYVNDGYQRVKIKIQPGWDLEPVAAIRKRFPDLSLMVDANAAYTIADQSLLRELDRYQLMMIEQPLGRDAHDEAAELQRTLRTPLCADESADSLATLASLIEKKAAQIINIKIQRVGGLGEALLMLEATRCAGLACWVGTMPELGVASAQGLHLATHSGFTLPTDIEASTRWYVDDVIEPLIKIDSNGFIHLPDGPGTGFKVSREKVERYSTAVRSFVA